MRHPYRELGARPLCPRYVTDADLRAALVELLELPARDLALIAWPRHVAGWLMLR